MVLGAGAPSTRLRPSRTNSWANGKAKSRRMRLDLSVNLNERRWMPVYVGVRRDKCSKVYWLTAMKSAKVLSLQSRGRDVPTSLRAHRPFCSNSPRTSIFRLPAMFASWCCATSGLGFVPSARKHAPLRRKGGPNAHPQHRRPARPGRRRTKSMVAVKAHELTR